MEEFLIGTGIALLLVILNWSEQIKNWHKDTMEAEKDFSEKRNLKWSQIRPLIRNKATATEKLSSLNELIREKSINEIQDIKIIDNFTVLDSKRTQLENLYGIKYLLILILTFLFFISGIINYFIDSKCKTQIFYIRVPREFIAISICVVFSLAILCFNIHLNNIENKYKNELINLMDQL